MKKRTAIATTLALLAGLTGLLALVPRARASLTVYGWNISCSAPAGGPKAFIGQADDDGTMKIFIGRLQNPVFDDLVSVSSYDSDATVLTFESRDGHKLTVTRESTDPTHGAGSLLLPSRSPIDMTCTVAAIAAER